MLKKIAVVGAAGLLAAVVLTQTKVGHMAGHWLDRAERHLDSKISHEDSIRDIKKEISKLDKDVQKAKAALAEEIVECRMLVKKVDDLRVSVDKNRSAVEARRGLFHGDDKPVKWDGRTVPISAAKDLLAREVSTQKALEAEYKAQEKMLMVRERTRTLAEQHLKALVSQKTQLEADVVDLEAQIKFAKIEQTQSKYQNDGTRMAEVKKKIAELRKKVEIQHETLILSKTTDPQSVENKTVDEIFAELDKKDGGDVIGKK